MGWRQQLHWAYYSRSRYQPTAAAAEAAQKQLPAVTMAAAAAAALGSTNTGPCAIKQHQQHSRSDQQKYRSQHCGRTTSRQPAAAVAEAAAVWVTSHFQWPHNASSFLHLGTMCSPHARLSSHSSNALSSLSAQVTPGQHVSPHILPF